MDQSVDVLDLVSSLLDNGKYKEALSVPNDDKYISSIKDNCWDLISTVIGKIQDETIVIKPSLQGACEELLQIIVQKTVPEEALLELIEQIELAKNDAQFSILLTPVQELLKKLTIKRGRSLEWCLNSISNYIEGIPIPEHRLEGKERLLLETDKNFRRIVRVYSLLPPFYSPFIKELSVEGANVRAKEIISAFLVSLLGKPLIFIDLDPESNLKSEARQNVGVILLDLCVLMKNILKFLPYIQLYSDERSNIITKNTSFDADELLPYEHTEKINMTTLSGLFYVSYSGHFEVPDSAVPIVYSNEYIFNTLSLCVVHLLGFQEYGPLHKGITLCKALFVYIPDKCSSTQLSSSTHYALSKSLIHNAIYSNYEFIRKNAVSLIKIHILRFEHKGRCMLIKYIINVANHSGMIGYSITLYKDSINEVFKENIEMPSCYTGAELIDMVKKICHLPHGAESNLIELADHIITTLNFLRYLLLRDTQNVTGIRDYVDTIETDYLDKLRIAFNMSKAHYELKLHDIENARKSEEEMIGINVGGNILNSIPKEKKIEIIHSALNGLHLIGGLVARLDECVGLIRNQKNNTSIQC